VLRNLLVLLLLVSLARAEPSAVETLLSRELTSDSAVQVALLNNPAVQALYRQVDISQADLEQASLLVNPVFSTSVRFPDQSGLPTNTEFGLSWNLLDLLRRGDREAVASTQLRQARLEVEDRLLEFRQEVQEAYYHYQAHRQSVDQLEIVLQASHAARELHQRQYKAGNIPQVALAQAEAVELDARIQLDQARYRLEQHQVRLNLLLGLAPERKLEVSKLSDIPTQEVALEGLEERALKDRPDLAVARLEVEADQQNLTLEAGGLLDEVSFDVSRESEAEAGGPIVTGPGLQFPVPIFDRRQGRVEHYRAKTEQSRQLLDSRQQRVRSEVRIAISQLAAARLKVEQLRDQMIPKRRQILLLSRPYYDSMLLGIYQLLELRQDLARARLELLEAIADYWSARAHLERTIGGRL
jgi:cobalt-zinc-cadmium efflux system outer membrane protein